MEYPIFTIASIVAAFIGGWYAATSNNRNVLFKERLSVYRALSSLLSDALIFTCANQNCNQDDLRIKLEAPRDYLYKEIFLISKSVGKDANDLIAYLYSTSKNNNCDQDEAIQLFVNLNDKMHKELGVKSMIFTQTLSSPEGALSILRKPIEKPMEEGKE